MKEFAIRLKGLPRQLSFVPPVRTIAYSDSLEAQQEQVVDGVQFCFRFHAADRGKILFERDGIAQEGGFPQLLIKRPGEFYRIEDVVRMCVFYFTYENEVLSFLREHGLPDDLICAELDISSRMSAAFRDICDLLEHSGEFGVADRVDLLALQLAEEALLAIEERRSPLSPPEERIARIISHLRLHFAADIDFGELAKKHGFSLRNFFRHWNLSQDKTPAQYVLELRMEEAKRLLASSRRGIGEIAFALGFRSESYFCHAFRRWTGTTPARYRAAQGM